MRKRERIENFGKWRFYSSLHLAVIFLNNNTSKTWTLYGRRGGKWQVASCSFSSPFAERRFFLVKKNFFHCCLTPIVLAFSMAVSLFLFVIAALSWLDRPSRLSRPFAALLVGPPFSPRCCPIIVELKKATTCRRPTLIARKYYISDNTKLG